MTGKAKTAAKPKADKAPAKCVFEQYDLKFGISKAEAEGLFEFAGPGQLNAETLQKLGADMVELVFDNLDRLWQVKAYYTIHDEAEAEALLERMSLDYRFQTPTSRVAFEVHEQETGGPATLYIRYTEINLKRIYLHHMMALGAAKLVEDEERAAAIKEKEEEEYIPTGPLIF